MPSLNGLVKGAVLVGLASITAVNAACSVGQKDLNGNFYCNPRNAIIYQNIGDNSHYQDVVGMDSESCKCTFASKSFGGNLAPFNEELSPILRGPIKLKQFAVYNLGGGASKRDTSDHLKRHAHAHHHLRKKNASPVEGDLEDRAVEIVVLTETVKVTKTEKVYAKVTATVIPMPLDGAEEDKLTEEKVHVKTKTSKKSTTETKTTSSATPTPTDWKRISYFTGGKTENVVFMNHNGGQGSGVFDDCFGMSLSYASTDFKSGASSPQTPGEVNIGSDNEFVLGTAANCDDGGCGFTFPGGVAHHGWGGSNKIFLFEIQTPSDGSCTYTPFGNCDMPAVWLLNSRIVNTRQYGGKFGECSCWTTGCGELDIYEALAPHNDWVRTAFHGIQGTGTQYGGGGSEDFFPRAKDGFITLAAVYQGDSKTVKLVLLDNFGTFPEGLTKEQVNKWGSTVSNNKADVFIASTP